MTMGTENLPAFCAESPVARSTSWASVEPPGLTATFSEGPRDDETTLYQFERIAFRQLLPTLEAQFGGKYVAIHRGTVVDADVSHGALVRRFFQKHGDTHVYVGYVGTPPIAHQLSPFRV